MSREVEPDKQDARADGLERLLRDVEIRDERRLVHRTPIGRVAPLAVHVLLDPPLVPPLGELLVVAGAKKRAPRRLRGEARGLRGVVHVLRSVLHEELVPRRRLQSRVRVADHAVPRRRADLLWRKTARAAEHVGQEVEVDLAKLLDEDARELQRQEPALILRPVERQEVPVGRDVADPDLHELLGGVPRRDVAEPLRDVGEHAALQLRQRRTHDRPARAPDPIRHRLLGRRDREHLEKARRRLRRAEGSRNELVGLRRLPKVDKGRVDREVDPPARHQKPSSVKPSSSPFSAAPSITTGAGPPGTLMFSTNRPAPPPSFFSGSSTEAIFARDLNASSRAVMLAFLSPTTLKMFIRESSTRRAALSLTRSFAFRSLCQAPRVSLSSA